MNGTHHIPISHVYYKDESELEEFIVDKNLSQICSTDEDESKGVIVEKYSTKEDESECAHKNINKQKDADNETDYAESSVTDEVPICF